MRGLWIPPLYQSLFNCTQWTVDTSLALELLSDYKLLYHYQPRTGPTGKLKWSNTFRSLLDLVRSQEHLNEYLPVSTTIYHIFCANINEILVHYEK